MPWFARIDENDEFVTQIEAEEQPEDCVLPLPQIISPKPLKFNRDAQEWICQASTEEREAFVRDIELRGDYAVGYRYDDTLTGNEDSTELNAKFPGSPRNFILYATVPQKAFTKLLNGQWSAPVDFV